MGVSDFTYGCGIPFLLELDSRWCDVVLDFELVSMPMLCNVDAYVVSPAGTSNRSFSFLVLMRGLVRRHGCKKGASKIGLVVGMQLKQKAREGTNTKWRFSLTKSFLRSDGIYTGYESAFQL